MNTPQASSPRRIAAWAGALLLTLLMAPSMASATGLLLPSDEALPPLAIKSHRVKIDITDQASVTRVEQVFVNHTDRQLEATFYFPVPLGATVSDFSLWINGRKTPGAVLEKNKARQIYERIVRRVQDPGLVEYMDGSIFQARIFPVPAKGEQKVEIAYASILEQIGPMRRVLYPLKTGRTAARLMQDFTVEAHIDSRAPLAAIYSPTHRVDVHRKSDHKAIVGVEQTAADLEEDFLLYIGTTDDDVGLSLLTHDPDGPGGKDGTFLMVLAPTFGDEDEELPPKAVTFVVDTSGSMAGDKIVQARKALSACLGKLRPEDHFNVVSFSTSVRKLFPKPVQASADRIKEGMAFAQNLEAAGGTAISDALDEALAGKPAGQMPHFVLFMTDGRPTVGTIEPNEILKEIRSKNGHKARVFTFGLGYDVNPILLDSVSREHRGYSDYVRPSEDIKVKVTGLYNKLAYPVMTDLQIDYGTHHVHDVYPRQLPDLFQGGQVVVMGRYSKELPTTIALSGTRGGRALTVTFDEIAPGQGDANKDAAHAFIPKLWATRKVGYLLEEIRANGELKELKDEVVRLATTYGLVTPYTSYLAVDDSEFEGQPAPRPGVVQGGAGDFKEYEFEDSLVEGNLRRDSRNYGARWQRDEALKKKGNMDADTGQGAVDASLATNDLKQVQSNEEANNNKTRWIDGRLFVLNTDGVWEEKGTEGRKARKIEYLSDEYFDLIEDRPDMKRRMSVGPNVQFEMDDEVLLVE